MNRFLLSALALCLLTAGLAACRGPQEPADMLIRNGPIITVDVSWPTAEALAIRGDRIVAVGNEEDVQAYVGPETKILDLNGKLAIPGFIEGHGHFMGIGQAKMNLDLMNVQNWDEAVEMVAQAAAGAEPGQWILGRGWHQDKWDRAPQPNVGGLPVHDSLSRISPENPVMLTHRSGHSSFVNAEAMRLAGIDARTVNPSGGEIVKDESGRPIGVLRETAQGLVRRSMAEARAQRTPEEIEAEARKQAELAAQECISNGLTSFQDAGSSFQTVDLFKALVAENKLPLRLWVMLREDNEDLRQRINEYRIIDLGDHRLTVRAIKRSIDGALGSHGAWLLEPYTDLPTSSGLNTTPVSEIRETARLAVENDFQLCVHAIGDRANRETLNLFEEIFRAHPDKTDLRWRIEHAQHLTPQDVPRFGQLGVIASMQAVHCVSDAPWVPIRLGEARAEAESYVWRDLMNAGAKVTNGTDAPVEDVSPVASFYAAVSRKTKDGDVFLPNQRMTRIQALRSYTLNNAYAAFEEDLKGTLTAGKLADITVLDRDIMSIDEEDIPGARVVYTIVGGKIVYQAE